MLIVYSKSCFCGNNKTLWKRVKAYAALKGLQVQERRISLNKTWKEDAERIGVELPFIVYGNNSVNLRENFEEIL